jgi:hypothetical protein
MMSLIDKINNYDDLKSLSIIDGDGPLRYISPEFIKNLGIFTILESISIYNTTLKYREILYMHKDLSIYLYVDARISGIHPEYIVKFFYPQHLQDRLILIINAIIKKINNNE